MTQATLTDIDRGLTCLLRTQHSQLRLAGGNHVGGVIGYANLSQISLQGDVLAKASVAGAQYAGGITGYGYGNSLTDCVNEGTITGQTNTG